MYKIKFTKPFIKQTERILKNNKELQIRIKKALISLSENPKYPSLKTHKITIPEHGKCMSSRVTGDLRIAWRFGKEKLTIIALDFGGHEGKHKLYK